MEKALEVNMLFLKSKYEKELEYTLSELKNYLSNNYKDAAHTCREQILTLAEQFYKDGNISQKVYKKYIAIYKHYTSLMKDYHH